MSGSNGLPSTPARAEKPASAVVVLLPPRAVAIDPLVRALARRGLSAVLAADAASVMVELAQRAVTAVVLVEPLPAVSVSLTAAVTAYHERTRVWRYEPPTQQKRAMLHAVAKAPDAADPPPAAAPPQASEDGVEDEGPLLTRDELAMLLEPLADRDPERATGLQERGGGI